LLGANRIPTMAPMAAPINILCIVRICIILNSKIKIDSFNE
jgi:hypothetical protein